MAAGLHKWEQRISIPVENGDCRNIILSLLACRGITKKGDIEDFLNPALANMHNPNLLPNIETATQRLLKAINESERVLVFGDYDADGIISLCLMYNFLKDLGLSPHTYIPSRFEEGYDINLKFISGAKEYGLIICVDCGTNSQEVKDFVAGNPDFPDIIVCDHHLPADKKDYGSFPKYTVINPKLEKSNYPFKDLSGAGVTFKFIVNVLRKLSRDKKKKFCSGYLTSLLDMVAISTIADVMPLIGENRIIVKKGLQALKNTSNPGLKCMVDTNIGKGKKINTYDIGFIIAPRLNSAGRLETARISSDILKSGTSNIEQKVQKLNSFNQSRKSIQDSILKDILNRKNLKETISKQKIFIDKSKAWNEGVLGIVASNMVKKFNVPVILFKEKGNKLKGSGRSVERFDLYEKLQSVNRFFDKFGGHKMACGITMPAEKFRDFKDELIGIASSQSDDMLVQVIRYDLNIDFKAIDNNLLQKISKLEPYGVGNPRPVFRTDRCRVKNICYLKGGKHIKLMLEKNGRLMEAVYFNINHHVKELLDRKDRIDVLYSLLENKWNGLSRIQLLLVDLF